VKHLTICDYGAFLGTREGMLLVRGRDSSERLYPLNRLSSLSIAKRGVSLSSDLVESLSERGIKLFFLGFRGTSHASLIGNVRHGVVAARAHQYLFCREDTLPLARRIIAAKIKNQRAVLGYYGKYHRALHECGAMAALQENARQALSARTREVLMGYEGESARCYFQGLRAAGLFPPTFVKREGRGSQEITNSMLNFGYAILSSYILAALENAGLEPYLGVIHGTRPGKPSLVLDLMEEYRAWVVDRAVVKLRTQGCDSDLLTPHLKKILIAEIQNTCAKKYQYRAKKVRLEHIIQRQVYRLSGHFGGSKRYRPYLFKW
jgi:CRISPR-associated protein Cas1